MLVKAIIGILIAAAVFYVAYVGAWLYLHLRFPALRISKAATEDQRLTQIDRWLEDLHQRHKFNGGVLIVRDGQPLLMRTYGYTDHTATHKLTTQSSFRLASISKQFTAAAILVLAEQRRLVLDKPVAEYLNAFPYADVTIRHLLNQTSGIPDVYMSLAKEHRDEVGEVLRIADVVTLLQKYPPECISQPGERYDYSNTNYVLLAAIIEQVSQSPIETFMRESLFEPLGMKNSRVWNRLSTDPFPKRAVDFDQIDENRTEVGPTLFDGIAGDGGVFCCLEDMLIWDRFWRRNQLVSDDLMTEAFRAPRLSDGTESAYGFGWVLDNDRAWHNGSWLGANTNIVHYRNRNGCLVVVDNSSNLRIDGITRQLEHAIAPLLLEVKPNIVERVS